MAGRVEWAALEGGEVETVLANLLYNKYGRALRVRPAQGDYGIDVIVPATEAAEPWNVYQIKKFATNLTEGQKNQIEKSFSRLLIGLVRRNFKINDWYLVMPLDPTTGNIEWFKTIPDRAIKIAKQTKTNPLTDAEKEKVRAWLTEPDRQIEWKGLIFCEPLAAEFPYVVDHYLHGGAERLRSAVDSIAGLLGGDVKARTASAAQPGEGPTALIEPAEMLDHLALLDSVLNTDPHYTYEHTVGPTLPAIQPEPNLVAATQRGLPNNRWLTFKIYQRSAQSLDERPIPIKLEFKFEQGSPEKEAFDTWQKYGKPFQATASFKIDLPGGLGGEGEAGKVSIPPPGTVNEFKLRLRIVDAYAQVLAELAFDMKSTVGEEGSGAWTFGTDASGTLEHEGYYDVTPGANQKVQFSLRPLAGFEAADAQPAVRFARHLKAPNKVQVARSVGPFNDLMALESADALAPPAIDRIVSALSIIQTRTTHVIRIPDFSELGPDEILQIRRVATLIEGGTRVAKWNHVRVEGVDEGQLEQGGHFQLALYKPLAITLDGIEIDLGAVEQILLSAVVDSVDGNAVRLVPNLNDTVHERFAEGIPDGAPAGRAPVKSRPYQEHREQGDGDDSIDASS